MATNPGPAALVSDVSAGRDWTYVGGNLTSHQYGTAEPLISLEIGLKLPAPSLVQMGCAAEDVERWISHRRSYLEETRIPARPVGDAIREDHDAALVRFQNRLDLHLEWCRRNVLDHALISFYETGANRVSFVLRNCSDEPLEDLKLVVQLNTAPLRVMTAPPLAFRLRAAPHWPEHALGSTTVEDVWPTSGSEASRPMPELGHGVVKHDGERDEIHYDLGHLGPTLKLTTAFSVLIPGPQLPPSETVSIHLTAYAKNTDGVSTADLDLTIESDIWGVESFVDPNYEL